MTNTKRDALAIECAKELEKIIPEGVPIQYRSAQKAATVHGFIHGYDARDEEVKRLRESLYYTVCGYYIISKPRISAELMQGFKALDGFVPNFVNENEILKQSREQMEAEINKALREHESG